MNVAFHHEATAEVRAAIAFYETEQVGLGRDLWDEIQATLQRTELNPDGPERVRPKLHRASVRRFPYSVIYGIRGDTVWVVAVAHHSRREGYWRSRV